MQINEHPEPVPTTERELLQVIGVMAAGAGIAPGGYLELLRKDLRRSPHPRRALNNLHRFLCAGFASSLLRDFQAHPVLQNIAIELFAQSQFLSDILVRQPELFHWLTSTTELKQTKSSGIYLREARETTQLFGRTEKQLDSLKRFQRRELLRIGARQILKEANVDTTSAELAALADAIIEVVVQLGCRDRASEGEIVFENELAVVGLGKLGGEELNFSSDIDLMFVYDRDGDLKEPHNRISTYHEFYNRLSEFVVRRLTEHTSEGHLYRVDMRLRPEGSSGSLALSRAAYMLYYEARGELWERQMLLKARVVAGNKEVGERWLRDVQPFVLPRTLLASPMEEIARIKSMIEARLPGEENIKLGSGGIRDIEFVVQALQLLNGGGDARLRERNTILAISRLAEASHITATERRRLQSAYRFLRTVEDRLQLLHAMQKHSLPESRDETEVLAKQLGFRGIREFEHELWRHRSRVRSVFKSVFRLEKRNRPKSWIDMKSELRSGKLTGRLRKAGFLDYEESARNIADLVREIPDLLDEKTLHRLISLARKHGAPDWCVGNFLTLASSQPIKRTFRQALTDDGMLDLLVLLCSRSSRLTRYLSSEPLLFESIVSRPDEILSVDRGWSFLHSHDLPRYKTYNEFKIAMRLIVGKASIERATSELSELADGIIRELFDQAVSEIREKGLRRDVALVALGKLGGNEITFESDLDLIVVYDGGGKPRTTKMAQELVQQFTESIKGIYEVDFRLRPEGKNSPLATEFSYYRSYLQDRVSLWERQSLLKARVLAGDKHFVSEVLAHLRRFTFDAPLTGGWTQEVLSMRTRMEAERSRLPKGEDLKFGKGGLVDLEFLMQVLQLRFGRMHEGIRDPNMFRLARALSTADILPKSQVTALQRNLALFRLLETFVRLNSEKPEFVIPTEASHRQAIVAALGLPSAKEFRSRLSSTRKENQRLFMKILKAAEAQ